MALLYAFQLVFFDLPSKFRSDLTERVWRILMHGKEIRMSRGKRYSTDQIIGFLREAEVLLSQGQKLGDVCRKLCISEQSCYRWRKTYGGLKMDQARQFAEL